MDPIIEIMYNMSSGVLIIATTDCERLYNKSAL